MSLHSYLNDTRSSIDVARYPLNSHEEWIVKRTQDLLVSKPMPTSHSAVIGILMNYRFQDGAFFLVRMHELFNNMIPSILIRMIRLHGRIISITAPEESDD